VEQRFVNDTKQAVNFRCELFAPERRRQMTQILAQNTGQKDHTYRLPEGDALLGKILWLRAAEIDGPRVFNYRFTAANE
jgi:hypothetical protein